MTVSSPRTADPTVPSIEQKPRPTRYTLNMLNNRSRLTNNVTKTDNGRLTHDTYSKHSKTTGIFHVSAQLTAEQQQMIKAMLKLYNEMRLLYQLRSDFKVERLHVVLNEPRLKRLNLTI